MLNVSHKRCHQPLDGMYVPSVFQMVIVLNAIWWHYVWAKMPNKERIPFVQKVVLKTLFERWQTVCRCFMWIVWSVFACFCWIQFSVNLVNCWFRKLLGLRAGNHVTFKEKLGVVKSCNCLTRVAASLIRFDKDLSKQCAYIPQKCLAFCEKWAMNKRINILTISLFL